MAFTLSSHKTIPQLSAETGVPVWTMRRVVDALGVAVRVYAYRLVPLDKVPVVMAELRRRGYLQAEEVTAHA